MTQAINYDAVLASASKTKQVRNPIVVMYADKGVGKTTWASQAPLPVFICGEDGAHSIAEIRLPAEGVVENWNQLLDYTRALAYAKHDHKTLVADTLGPLSALCLAGVVAQSGKSSWEKMGWGKEEDLVREWRVWLSLLEHCRNKRGMSIVLLAHAMQRGVNNAQLGERYYIWQGEMHPQIWSITSNWADIVLYGAREMLLHEPEHGKTRALMKADRWLYAHPDTGFEAKVRAGYRLPTRFPLSYAAFQAELNETAAGVRARITALAVGIGGDVAAKAAEFVKEAGDSITDLKVIEKKLAEMKK